MGKVQYQTIFDPEQLNLDVRLMPLNKGFQIGKKFLDEERMKKRDEKDVPFEHNLEFLVDPFFRKTT